MFTIVQAASGDSRSKVISLGIVGVEAEDFGPLPLVDTASAELPFRSVAGPGPVDETTAETRSGEGRKARSLGSVIAFAQDPRFADQPGKGVFPLVCGEVTRRRRVEDVGAEGFDVDYVVETPLPA
jgi:hypothetical protein